MYTHPNEKQMEMKEVPWLVVVHVKPCDGNKMLGDATGAFVTTVALGIDREDVVQKITSKCSSYELEVIELEDVDLLSEMISSPTLSPELIGRAQALSNSEPVAFVTFHCY